MPEEIAIILVTMMMGIFFLSFTKMILSHRRKSKETQQLSQSSEGALTTSELEAMMTRAVENSMIGLHGKIEDLELEVARLGNTARQLPEVDTPSRLELEDEVIEVEPVRAAKRDRI